MIKSKISDVESERYSIAGLLNNIKVLSELPRNFTENIYHSRLYGTCFSAIQEAVKDGEDVNPYLIATKISNLGMSFEELSGGTLLEHLEEIKSGISLTEQATLDFIKRLCKISLLREREAAANKISEFVRQKSNWELPAEDIINFTDQAFQGNLSLYTREGGEFVKIFDQIESIIEERGNNPMEDFGFYGPFDTFNKWFDAPFTPGDIHVTASRSNVGKTSWGFFQAISVIEKYQCPFLWIDAGEMLPIQIMRRAVCAFSKGVITTHMLKSGKWRQNKELTKIVRDIWPRVQKIKDLFYFRNVGGLNSKEICSTMRRFWLSEVGRFANLPSFDNPLGPSFPVNYDYLKPVSAGGNKDAAEWQEVGSHMENMKSLITSEVPACIHTYLQTNRSAISRGKKMGQFDISESSFSMSDRVYHNASNAMILREKTTDELADENQQFGNRALHLVKKRDLGELAHKALSHIRQPDGSLVENYLHYSCDGFFWEEKGTLEDSVIAQGDVNDDLDDDGDAELK